VRPPSGSTHQPTREAGQLLPISVSLPAPTTLHKTPFVDVADGIYRDMLVTESCAEYRLHSRGNYRDKDMPRYDLNIVIFDTIRYIVPSLVAGSKRLCLPSRLPRVTGQTATKITSFTKETTVM